MKKISLIIIIVSAVVAGSYYYHKTSSDGDQHKAINQVRVGILLPTTGSGGEIGQDIKDGIDLAINLASSSVTSYFEDTQDFGALGAITAYKKIASLNSPDFIIGPLGPAASIGLASSESPSSTENIYSVSLCDDSFKSFKNLYCSYPSLQTQTYANEPVLRYLKSNKIQIISEEGALGDTFVNTTKEILARNSMTLVNVSYIKADQKDFRNEILSGINDGADTLMIAMSPGNDITLLKQLREYNYKGYVLFNGDKTEEELSKIKTPDNFYIPPLVSKEYDSYFRSKFFEMYNREPTFYNALGYSIAVLAINKHLGTDYKVAIKGLEYDDYRQVSEVEFTPMKFVDAKLVEFMKAE